MVWVDLAIHDSFDLNYAFAIVDVLSVGTTTLSRFGNRAARAAGWETTLSRIAQEIASESSNDDAQLNANELYRRSLHAIGEALGAEGVGPTYQKGEVPLQPQFKDMLLGLEHAKEKLRKTVAAELRIGDEAIRVLSKALSIAFFAKTELDIDQLVPSTVGDEAPARARQLIDMVLAAETVIGMLKPTTRQKTRTVRLLNAALEIADARTMDLEERVLDKTKLDPLTTFFNQFLGPARAVS